MILVLDNYDSFVYNLVQYLGMLGANTRVVRNDQISADGIHAMKPAAILISPGPCGPDEAGISVEAVRRFSGQIPILGICLGHQAIARAFQGQVRRAQAPMHGKTSRLVHEGTGLFQGLPPRLNVCRYHSLAVEASSLPPLLVPTGWAEDGELMAIQHVSQAVYGLQFHPESYYTEYGLQMMKNFICEVQRFWGRRAEPDGSGTNTGG